MYHVLRPETLNHPFAMPELACTCATLQFEISNFNNAIFCEDISFQYEMENIHFLISVTQTPCIWKIHYTLHYCKSSVDLSTTYILCSLSIYLSKLVPFHLL